MSRPFKFHKIREWSIIPEWRESTHAAAKYLGWSLYLFKGWNLIVVRGAKHDERTPSE